MVGSIDDFDWRWDILNENISVDDFVCEKHHEFEDFLKNAALLYQEERLAITYVILVGNKLIAYYSLATDKVVMNDSDKNLWKRLSKKIPFDKRRRGYPALKLCQLAVDDNYAHNGFGKQIITQVMLSASDFKVGCRFITVDALPEAEDFYKKMGFTRLSGTPNPKNDTIPMYFDLGRIEAQPENQNEETNQ
ncbi:MAG: GNAT family N-acetyltransferase [Salinivirgaceae bacterium]|nr:GNAT family N-acetyltransferase [Salinivirgaceae bacterium]